MKTLSKNEKIAVGVAVAAAFAIFVFFAPSIVNSLFINNTNNATVGTAMNSNITAESLKIQDTEIGTGAEAKAGDIVKVKYLGKLMDGSVFDSSEAHGGEPIEFMLGSGQVIKGWDQGLLGMKVGGKRSLLIAPELGYGEQGIGPIPANSTLYFEVELVGIATQE